MRTKRTSQILAIAIALFTLLLGVKPAQAEPVEPLPATGASYVAPNAVVAGRTFESTLHVWSFAGPLQFSAPAAEVTCSQDNVVLSGDATGITGLNSGESNTTPFQRTTNAYVPPSLEGFTCIVTSKVSFGGDAVFPATFTFEVLPQVYGSVNAVDTTHEIMANENRRFKATLVSNIGPVTFRDLLVNIDCGPLFADDYRVSGEPLLELNSIEYQFDVMMPPVLVPTFCFFNGSVDTSAGYFNMTQTSIRVIPLPVPPTHEVALPMVIAP